MKHYRYSDTYHAISLEIFNVIRETPCGYWIAPDWANDDDLKNEFKKWVSKTSRKRYAYPTMEEAWKSYKLRKRRHTEVLEDQLEAARVRLNVAEHTIGSEAPDEYTLARLPYFGNSRKSLLDYGE